MSPPSISRRLSGAILITAAGAVDCPAKPLPKREADVPPDLTDRTTFPVNMADFYMPPAASQHDLYRRVTWRGNPGQELPHAELITVCHRLSINQYGHILRRKRVKTTNVVIVNYRTILRLMPRLSNSTYPENTDQLKAMRRAEKARASRIMCEAHPCDAPDLNGR